MTYDNSGNYTLFVVKRYGASILFDLPRARFQASDLHSFCTTEHENCLFEEFLFLITSYLIVFFLLSILNIYTFL